jgi:2,5-diamino-6-(ribosylamino)-4(3H)-pyrimidinone 5'-phosphate reductase
VQYTVETHTTSHKTPTTTTTKDPSTKMPSTDITHLSDSEVSFLTPYLPESAPTQTQTKPPSLPFVTLTYACSLDGMIALAPGVRTSLSGPETKSMTHYLRLKHDAILVGAGTAVADAPSLNCRYPGAGLEEQPRPVVVDPKGRWEVKGSAVAKLAEEGRGKDPWVVSGGLYEIGAAKLVIAKQGKEGGMEWEDVLRALKEEGVESVMIEGGATVINALLAKPHLVNSVIITVAPTWLGQGGLAASPAGTVVDGQRVNAASLLETAWRQFGADAVLCGRPAA